MTAGDCGVDGLTGLWIEFRIEERDCGKVIGMGRCGEGGGFSCGERCGKMSGKFDGTDG